MNLLCVPYAGGTSLCYRSFKCYLPNWLHMTTVSLPGRGGESADSFEDVVEDIYERYAYIFQNNDYALFGHSMGSTMVFELVYKIMERGGALPKHVFFSGRRVPQRSFLYNRIANRAPEEFNKEIIKLGGIPDLLLQSPEAFEFFMEQIYKDVLLLESYTYKEGRNILEIDISVFYGKDDEKLDEKESEYWKWVTNKNCNIYGFEGAHFFINENANEVVSIISNELKKYMI